VRKEGTGKPRDPDIAFDAGVRMRELYFEDVPDPEVRFWGSTRRNSVWESGRENLPDEVQEGVVYRDARVRLQIASEVADSGFDLRNSSERGWVKTSRKNPKREAEGQETTSKERQ